MFLLIINKTITNPDADDIPIVQGKEVRQQRQVSGCMHGQLVYSHIDDLQRATSIIEI